MWKLNWEEKFTPPPPDVYLDGKRATEGDSPLAGRRRQASNDEGRSPASCRLQLAAARPGSAGDLPHGSARSLSSHKCLRHQNWSPAEPLLPLTLWCPKSIPWAQLLAPCALGRLLCCPAGALSFPTSGRPDRERLSPEILLRLPSASLASRRLPLLLLPLAEPPQNWSRLPRLLVPWRTG